MFCGNQSKLLLNEGLQDPNERYVTIAGWIRSQCKYEKITVTLYRAKTFSDKKDSNGIVVGRQRKSYPIKKKVDLCPDGSYRITGLVREKYSMNYFLKIKLDEQPQEIRTIVIAGFAPRYRWKRRIHDLVI